MSKQDTIDIEISSMAAPTDEDRAKLEAMPLEIKRSLFLCEVDKGLKGPFAKHDIADIIAEAKAEIKR